jgi:cytochrome c556
MLRAARGNLIIFKAMLGSLLISTMLAGCGPHPDTHPGQPVTKRKVIFHNMLRAFEPMGLVIRGRASYDRNTFLKHAVELDTLAKQPWSYFTSGSYYSPTRAKPTVWQYPAEFKAKEQNLLEATAQLARVSQTGNLDTIRPAYENVVHACNACHSEFRRSGF